MSRLRIVEAADEARRRIERDLHDGAQQQLLALALELRVLRSSISRSRGRTAGRRARGAPGGGAQRPARARARHPSRHPHAQRARPRDRRARRTARRSRSTCRGRDRRPPGAGGRGGRVLRRGGGADQRRALLGGGRGARRAARRRQRRHRRGRQPTTGSGARTRDAGSGLRGLQDRLAVVDGVLSIDSPPGAGTRLEATIPSPQGRREARGGQRARSRCSWSCWPAAAGRRACASRTVVVTPSQSRRAAPRARRGPAAACASPWSPTVRRRARSGPSCATASRPRRARWTSSSTTARPTSTASRAWRR